MKAIFRRKLFWFFVIIVVAVLLVPVMRAIWVRDYGNRKLSEMPDYRTHVGAVTLHFWRGAYSVHNIKVVKTSGKVSVPFFSAPMVDLSVEWMALFHGTLFCRTDLHNIARIC